MRKSVMVLFDRSFSSLPMFSQGKVVYANYGRREDLENLQNQRLNLTENIALVRAGKISLAEKVRQISLTQLWKLSSSTLSWPLLSARRPGRERRTLRSSCGSDLSGAEQWGRTQRRVLRPGECPGVLSPPSRLALFFLFVLFIYFISACL